MAIDGELIRPPEMILDNTLEQEERVALEGLQHVIQSAPDIAQESLDLYFANPDTVKRMVAFMRDHPEGGLAILEAVDVVIDNRLDMMVEFDEATEAAVAADASYKNAVEKFKKTSDEQERTWFRRRRLGIAIARARAAKAA